LAINRFSLSDTGGSRRSCRMLVFNRSTPPRGTLSPSPENCIELALFCFVSISLRFDQVQVKQCVASGCYNAVEQLSLESFYPTVPFPSCDLGFSPSLSNNNQAGSFPVSALLVRPSWSMTPQSHRLHKSQLHKIIDLTKNGAESDRQTESFNNFKHIVKHAVYKLISQG